MNAYEIPSLRYSLPAGGVVAQARFVTADANGNGIQSVAGGTVIGASMNEVKVDQVLEIADGIVNVTAGAIVAAGAQVASDASGKAITRADTALTAGIALTGATTVDQLISVKI